jgi:hypothetical protein
MTRYDNVLDAIGGTAFAKLVRVLLAVHELTDFSGGQQWLAIPLVADFREQLESRLIPDEASYFDDGVGIDTQSLMPQWIHSRKSA